MVKDKFNGSILLTSLHGYVSKEPELGKPDTGGQVMYILELAKRFFRLGYKVDIVTRRFEDQPEYDIIGEGLRIWRVPYGGKAFIRKENNHEYLTEFINNILSVIKAKSIHYDVIYSHYWDAGWASQKIAEHLQIPHVHTPHSLGIWKKLNMPGDAAQNEKHYRFEERINKEFFIYKMCDHIITTTEEQYEFIRDQYDVLERLLSIIPAGMDEARFSPLTEKIIQEKRKKLDIGPTDILAVGRMAPNKGFDLLIKAMPYFFELIPKGRLIAAFGGADSESDNLQIKKLKILSQNLGIAGKIKWVGYIKDEDLADAYRCCGAFPLPSKYEPFGMTAIEAMSCGTPTVITVHGGLFKLIEFGKHALYADSKRSLEFGVVLALPLLHPRLSQLLSTEGSRFARRHFGWTGIAKRILDIFEQLKYRYKEENEDKHIFLTPEIQL